MRLFFLIPQGPGRDGVVASTRKMNKRSNNMTTGTAVKARKEKETMEKKKKEEERKESTGMQNDIWDVEGPCAHIKPETSQLSRLVKTLVSLQDSLCASASCSFSFTSDFFFCLARPHMPAKLLFVHIHCMCIRTRTLFCLSCYGHSKNSQFSVLDRMYRSGEGGLLAHWQWTGICVSLSSSSSSSLSALTFLAGLPHDDGNPSKDK